MMKEDLIHSNKDPKFGYLKNGLRVPLGQFFMLCIVGIIAPIPGGDVYTSALCVCVNSCELSVQIQRQIWAIQHRSANTAVYA